MSARAVRIEIEPGFRPQSGPQTAFVNCPCDIVVYGGARGGGKTFGSLGDFWCHAEDYGPLARGLMFRKTREDLKDTIATGQAMYGSGIARWKEKGGFFDFANGARLYCTYLEKDSDAENYQGWSVTRLYPEELTQHATPGPVMKLLATLRSAHGVPCQMKATCNPGGPGHHWVKSWIVDHGPYNVVEDESGLSKVFIPALVSDNPKLLENDPTYINKLRASGSPELVRAWLEGDWNVIEGSFFPEFTQAKHVIAPFVVPAQWVKFRSLDWGSAKPFSVGWWCVVQDDFRHDGRLLPRGAIVRYREWYGQTAQGSNVGLKMPAEQVAQGIVSRETHNGARERISYGIADPGCWAIISGPSVAETLFRHGAPFRKADNSRVSKIKKMGGWDQLRARLAGNADGDPMMFVMSHCRELIRTLPMMQHDANNPEDVDTDGEDHAVDETRYACLSRPFLARTETVESRNPYLIANCFKLKELR